MSRSGFLSYFVLWPISVLYGIGVRVRNGMYNKNMLSSRSFDDETDVVCIGNIAVGGTGKTPHTEYLLEKMSEKHNVAMLSRGYRRLTKGFVKGDNTTGPDEIGDEPFQVYRKFAPRGVTVAVCEDRSGGIDRLLEESPRPSYIVLDDAFQHRRVRPTVSVVLTEYGRPVFSDHLLPYGRLREPSKALERADIVVVTKCPDSAKPMDFRLFREKLDLYPYQKLLFSKYVYGTPVALYPDVTARPLRMESLTATDAILAVCGIANPRPFVKQLRRKGAKVKSIRYPDHHRYSDSDFERIAAKFKNLKGNNKFIITTEKDAVRLLHSPDFPDELKPYIFYIPVTVQFLPYGDGELFEAVTSQIRNRRNNPF